MSAVIVPPTPPKLLRDHTNSVQCKPVQANKTSGTNVQFPHVRKWKRNSFLWARKTPPINGCIHGHAFRKLSLASCQLSDIEGGACSARSPGEASCQLQACSLFLAVPCYLWLAFSRIFSAVKHGGRCMLSMLTQGGILSAACMLTCCRAYIMSHKGHALAHVLQKMQWSQSLIHEITNTLKTSLVPDEQNVNKTGQRRSAQGPGLKQKCCGAAGQLRSPQLASEQPSLLTDLHCSLPQ